MNLRTLTNTDTQTTTITALDVRQVFAEMTVEISTITRIAGLPATADVEASLVDASILALNDVIDSIRLQFYLGDELVREHAYRITEAPCPPSGPPPDQPPTEGLERLPTGSRVRLVATRKAGVPHDVWLGWLQRLGWRTAPELRIPPHLLRRAYGVLASGGYSVNRELAIDPRYDVPAAGTEPGVRGEEGRR